MTWVVPASLEEALRAAARDELGAGVLAPTRLHAAVVDRSRRYTSEREALSNGRDSDDDLAARAVFFSVADAPKVWPALGELCRVGVGRGDRVRRALRGEPGTALKVLDLGAGCGAMSLGILVAAATLSGAGVEGGNPDGAEVALYLADVDARALAIAKGACARLAQTLGVRCSIHTAVTRFGGAAPSKLPADWPMADLVVMGSVLNELSAEAAQGVLALAAQRCAPGGAVVVIEPALRGSARALQALRNEMIARLGWHVVAPCTHLAPCPMMASERDWCHWETPYVLPPLTGEVARVTGLRDGAMKYAYVVALPHRVPYAASAQPCGDDAAPTALLRIVDRPRASKGKLELLACGASGLVTLRRLNRNRAAANRELDLAGRGDVLVLGESGEGPLVPPVVAIHEDHAMQRVAPATSLTSLSLLTSLASLAIVGWLAMLGACQQPTSDPASRISPSAAPPILEPAHLARFAPLPAAPAQPAALVELGRQLFLETSLSLNNDLSCASCHPLNAYGMDGLTVARGTNAQLGTRNTPTVYNAAYQSVLFWDGRAGSVEIQAKMPVLSPVEMAMPSEAAVVARLAAMPRYVALFAAAFPGDDPALTYQHLADALGAYEKTLLTPSRWDAFLRGDRAALTESEQRGARLFVETGCPQCHLGALVGGHIFQKLGRVEPWPGLAARGDRGRFQVTGAKVDEYVFKVPSLRNVAETAPYLHDGSVPTLHEQIKLMARHQLGKQLTADEIELIASFLASLTGPAAAPPSP